MWKSAENTSHCEWLYVYIFITPLGQISEPGSHRLLEGPPLVWAALPKGLLLHPRLRACCGAAVLQASSGLAFLLVGSPAVERLCCSWQVSASHAPLEALPQAPKDGQG